MKKYILVIVLLIISILLSFRYLDYLLANRKAFLYRESDHFLLLQKKEVLLNELSDFSFEDYFLILSKADLSYGYQFDQNLLRININGKDFLYPYRIREKETVEKVIYKEVVKEVEVFSTGQEERINQESAVQPVEEEEDYLEIRKDSLSFEKGSSLQEIIAAIQRQIDTNMRITVDYSLLNPNQIGQYRVYIIAKEEKYEISVEIT